MENRHIPRDTVTRRRRKQPRWLTVGLMVVIAIAIGACSVDLDEARTIHEDGFAMLEDGEWEDAAAAFSQVIDLEPSDSDLLASA